MLPTICAYPRRNTKFVESEQLTQAVIIYFFAYLSVETHFQTGQLQPCGHFAGLRVWKLSFPILSSDRGRPTANDSTESQGAQLFVPHLAKATRRPPYSGNRDRAAPDVQIGGFCLLLGWCSWGPDKDNGASLVFTGVWVWIDRPPCDSEVQDPNPLVHASANVAWL